MYLQILSSECVGCFVQAFAISFLTCFIASSICHVTVQTIAFLAWLRHHNREKNGCKEPEVITLDDDNKTEETTERPYTRPHLIVVPASVLTNWEREFEKFCPDMHIIKYHGSMTERDELKEELRKHLPSRNGRANPNVRPVDVVLTTFSYFSGEKSDDRSFLKKFQFDYLVVDEAHSLKNSRGQRYRNLDKIGSSHRLLLTGTCIPSFESPLLVDVCFFISSHFPLLNRNSCTKLAERAHVTLVLSHASVLSPSQGRRYRLWR